MAEQPALQALKAEVQELREELAAVRAWCEGLEDEQVSLWRGLADADGTPTS